MKYSKKFDIYFKKMSEELANIHAKNSSLHKDLQEIFLENIKQITHYKDSLKGKTEVELKKEYLDLVETDSDLTTFDILWYAIGFSSKIEELYPYLIEFTKLRLQNKSTYTLFQDKAKFVDVPNEILLEWLLAHQKPVEVFHELFMMGFDIDKQKKHPLEKLPPTFLKDLQLHSSDFETIKAYEPVHEKYNIDMFGAEPTLLSLVVSEFYGDKNEIAEALILLGANPNKFYGRTPYSNFDYVSDDNLFYGFNSSFSVLIQALEGDSDFEDDGAQQRNIVRRLIELDGYIETSIFYCEHPLAIAIRNDDEFFLEIVLSKLRREEGESLFENWNLMAVKYVNYVIAKVYGSVLNVLCNDSYFKNLPICLAKRGKSILVNIQDRKSYIYLLIVEERGELGDIVLTKDFYAPASVSLIPFNESMGMDESNLCSTAEEALDRLGVVYTKVTDEEIKAYIVLESSEGI